MGSNPIDKDMIVTAYQTALESVTKIIPLSQWKILPNAIELHSHHGKYGQATSDGTVLIYQGFLGTKAHNRLSHTVRHELAHLCVGLEQHHNRVFRHVEVAFGCSTQDLEGEEIEIQANIPYKWVVIAHLENGQAVEVGGVHRKTKKWADYHTQDKRTDRLKGIVVSRYEFVKN